MKRTLLIILPLLLIINCSKPVKDEAIKEKDGIKYHPDTKEPYSKKVYRDYKSGGKEYEGSYKDGKKDGKWTYWYENGQKWMEGTYRDGKQDGKSILWYENGNKKSETNYKSGLKSGQYKLWYESGSIMEEGYKKDGKLNGKVSQWHSSGKQKSEIRYDHGIRSGSFTIWYENGRLKEKGSFLDNRRHGDYSRWYENGTLEFIGSYSTGNKKGLWTFFNTDGIKTKSSEYSSDKLHGLYTKYISRGITLVRLYDMGRAKGSWDIPHGLTSDELDQVLLLSGELISSDKRKAIVLLESLVKNYSSESQWSKGLLLLGDIYERELKDFDRALGFYGKLIDNHSRLEEEPIARFKRGKIYADKLGAPDLALHEFKSFLEVFPNHILADSVKLQIEHLK